ncbi:tyrosine-type recombinase/integrase [Octadecabacter sp. G9-8]|uniref:Tyrosine-type recombinase/integrase n=1 Tax=Octadecabacter dasysiphoniae TaxID=2909341 RepID=A0ABS9D2M2_9RHOB|nr:site-specific integrase [Octadecabacter dasysiphoniae]MCF2872671.1 tyrosine-type recombinase/integrase [Octadecabacter dasysiphoniae]
MPKTAEVLNDKQIKSLKHLTGKGAPRIVAVGGVAGLRIVITASNTKNWSLRVTITGQGQREFGLGSYPTVGLEEVREKARKYLKKARKGIDPVEERKAKKAAAKSSSMTFAKAVKKYAKVGLGKITTDKGKARWHSAIDTYVIPVIGDMTLQSIEPKHVAKCLIPIWADKTVTATKLRGHIEKILGWATVEGHRKGDNPARFSNNLEFLLPEGRKAVSHAAVQINDAPRFFATLRKMDGMGSRALEFLMLTAVRSGEVRGARWDEVDFEAGIWSIAAERMKMKRPHRVPLPTVAIRLLQDLPRLHESELVFPADRGGTLSDMTLSAAMKRMSSGDKPFRDGVTKAPAVPHGLRSTFKDWSIERTEYPNELSEVALAHKVGSATEQAYARSDMLQRRRDLMEDWAKHLTGPTGATVAADNFVAIARSR